MGEEGGTVFTMMEVGVQISWFAGPRITRGGGSRYFLIFTVTSSRLFCTCWTPLSPQTFPWRLESQGYPVYMTMGPDVDRIRARGEAERMMLFSLVHQQLCWLIEEC
jgi:hypothetical protein